MKDDSSSCIFDTKISNPFGLVTRRRANRDLKLGFRFGCFFVHPWYKSCKTPLYAPRIRRAQTTDRNLKLGFRCGRTILFLWHMYHQWELIFSFYSSCFFTSLCFRISTKSKGDVHETNKSLNFVPISCKKTGFVDWYKEKEHMHGRA